MNHGLSVFQLWKTATATLMRFRLVCEEWMSVSYQVSDGQHQIETHVRRRCMATATAVSSD